MTIYFKVKLNDAIESCYTKIDNILLNLINIGIGLFALYGFYKVSNKINKKIVFVISIILSLIFWICLGKLYEIYSNK